MSEGRKSGQNLTDLSVAFLAVVFRTVAKRGRAEKFMWINMKSAFVDFTLVCSNKVKQFNNKSRLTVVFTEAFLGTDGRIDLPATPLIPNTH